jgi:phosphate transport system protein
MRVKFDGQLQLLNTEMIQMGHMIENAIRESIEAFFCQDVGKAGRIMQDDDLIDREQKKIENMNLPLLKS